MGSLGIFLLVISQLQNIGRQNARLEHVKKNVLSHSAQKAKAQEELKFNVASLAAG